MPAARSQQVQDETRDEVATMTTAVIGVDPHKLSVTIEVVDNHEKVLATGRFATDKAGYAAMRQQVRRWPERARAGPSGSGRSRAATAPADRRRRGCSPTTSTSWTCPRSSRLWPGCSTPATTARPTRMPSRWSRCARQGYGCCPTSTNSRRCECWPTAVRS